MSELRHPQERLDDLCTGGRRIIQRTDRFCFSMDAVLLAHFPTLTGRERVLDLGTGTGIIPLLIADHAAAVTAVEIDPVQAELAARRLHARQSPAVKPAAVGKAAVARPSIHPCYAEHINQASARYGVSPLLISAVIGSESACQKGAVSPKGARGLMQVMPDTARAMGYDPADMFEPAIAIDAGTRYLGIQLRTFGRVDLGLAAYNAGPRAVERYGGIPPYRETRNYVVKTVRQYAKNYLRSLQ